MDTLGFADQIVRAWSFLPIWGDRTDPTFLFSVQSSTAFAYSQPGSNTPSSVTLQKQEKYAIFNHRRETTLNPVTTGFFPL
jgi:hypothetical protein